MCHSGSSREIHPSKWHWTAEDGYQEEERERVSVKIPVSYEEPGELRAVLVQLGPMVRSYKVARRQQGRFKRAYIDCCPIQKPEKT